MSAASEAGASLWKTGHGVAAANPSNAKKQTKTQKAKRRNSTIDK